MDAALQSIVARAVEREFWGSCDEDFRDGTPRDALPGANVPQRFSIVDFPVFPMSPRHVAGTGLNKEKEGCEHEEDEEQREQVLAIRRGLARIQRSNNARSERRLFRAWRAVASAAATERSRFPEVDLSVCETFAPSRSVTSQDSADLRLAGLLQRLGLDHYLHVLLENEIDFSTLSLLTESDLLRLGLKVGAVKRLLHAVSSQDESCDPLAQLRRNSTESTIDSGASVGSRAFAASGGSVALSDRSTTLSDRVPSAWDSPGFSDRGSICSAVIAAGEHAQAQDDAAICTCAACERRKELSAAGIGGCDADRDSAALVSAPTPVRRAAPSPVRRRAERVDLGEQRPQASVPVKVEVVTKATSMPRSASTTRVLHQQQAVTGRSIAARSLHAPPAVTVPILQAGRSSFGLSTRATIHSFAPRVSCQTVRPASVSARSHVVRGSCSARGLPASFS
eukprot:TRINITY_DN64179_c0_g1_i1.p1 TRINITY_DN64179_c0_g1~~TRINITY_DN64179_c0_g1_i1.p1  ORF type:complete len:453 (-),score=78.66 TRINITY_DN64179_c0_g1_i1:214-1572(-)